MRYFEIYYERLTSMQRLFGNLSGRFRIVWKYWATVLLVPSRKVKLKSAAPALLNFLTTRGVLFSPAYVVLTRMPEIKRCKRIRSRSGKPLRGLSNACCPGLPRNSRQISISDPDLYIVPVEMSTLTRSCPIAGLTDWKYPRHKTRPEPMSFVSRSVKKDRTLKGYFIVGSIRTTTFNACRIHDVNYRSKHPLPENILSKRSKHCYRVIVVLK